MATEPIQTRETDEDSPEVYKRIEDARRSGRGRTIAMSIVASGLVALVFTYSNERDQIDRSRTNCDLTQEDRRERVRELRRDADRLNEQVTFVLGDKNTDPPIKPFDFEGTAFEDLAALSIQQAKRDRKEVKQDRNEADRISGRIEDCDKVHPYPDLNPFS